MCMYIYIYIYIYIFNFGLKTVKLQQLLKSFCSLLGSMETPTKKAKTMESHVNGECRLNFKEYVKMQHKESMIVALGVKEMEERLALSGGYSQAAEEILEFYKAVIQFQKEDYEELKASKREEKIEEENDGDYGPSSSSSCL